VCLSECLYGFPVRMKRAVSSSSSPPPPPLLLILPLPSSPLHLMQYISIVSPLSFNVLYYLPLLRPPSLCCILVFPSRVCLSSAASSSVQTSVFTRTDTESTPGPPAHSGAAGALALVPPLSAELRAGAARRRRIFHRRLIRFSK